jgi:hypothetical protein
VKPRLRTEIADEFMHTWDRHGGRVSVAAPILGLRPDNLARALYRARQDGMEVKMIDDQKAWRKRQKRQA